MRKNLAYFSIIAAAALLTGCFKTEVTSSPISFNPVAAKATRAIIQGTTYPEGESFLVCSYHNGTTAYFSDLIASYTTTVNGTKLWETSSTEYWPLAGSLDFTAYSPANVNTTQADDIVDITHEHGVVAAGYTIQNATQLTTDLCCATATVADCANHPEYVSLAFSHALSQVVFRVAAADYHDNTTLSLSSLSASGICSVGDLSDGAWSNQTSEHTYPITSTPTTLTYGAGNVPDTLTLCSYLFVPQTLGANAALNVGYSMTQTVNATPYTIDYSESPVAIHLGGTIAQWQPGKKYIYTLIIGLNNLITFTATAAAWNETDAGVVVE